MKYLSFLFMMFCISAIGSAQSVNGSVVAVDKMNVLYYGIDNPVTIGAPNDWQHAVISITNGTISGSGSQRVVRPASVDQKTTITIDIQGKKTSYDFRVKKLPDPVFKIGSGKLRIPAAEFKSQVICRADPENLHYNNVNFEVVSAIVYFSGANFEHVMTYTFHGHDLTSIQKLMEKCMPGTSISFCNIKVQGPDGVRTIPDRTFTLY